MDLDLIKTILIVAIGASIFSTATIQKIKEQLKSKTWLFFITVVVSFGIGITFSLCFSDLSLINSIWVGLATWVGADLIYKAFEDKIFIPFSEMNTTNDVVINRGDVK